MSDTTWIERLIMLAIVGILVAIAVTGFRNERLIRECMADGRKEYECRAMLDSGHYYPVVIR